MSLGMSGRLLKGFGTLALVCAMFASGSKTSDGRSLDPATCTSGEERVAFSNLVFCWPTGPDAPDYSFEMPDTMQGSQDINGKPAIFTIFPVASSMFRAFSEEIGHKERIAQAVEVRAGHADALVLELYEGKHYGQHTFEFRKVGSKLFAASETLSAEGFPPQQIDYWVAMTDGGKVDYVMRCGGFGKKPDCHSQFILFDNLVRIGILSAPKADEARNAFEVLRSRMRSYVVSPNLAP